MKKNIIAVLFLIFLSSCVPTKDLIYLQEKEKSSQQNVQAEAFKPYRIQIGDQLRIDVKTDVPGDRLSPLFKISSQTGGNANQGGGIYFSSYVVDEHGNVRIPLIGEVNALGFTADEIRLKVEEKLREDHYTENVNLFVDVKLAGFRFSVNGEVKSTGTQTLFQDRVTIMEAIATAGDITTVGNRREVSIIRRFPHGSEIYTIDLTDRKIMESPHYYIQPNDYIYVKPLPQKSWGTGTTGTQTMSTIITSLSLLMTTIVLIGRLQ
ncbi:MAG: polysaccharide biosynthesis/export family protein [Flavobacteriaceae bacterium]